MIRRHKAIYPKSQYPMTYKGYLGSVAYSEKDQVFFGKVEGINGLVNYGG